MIERALAGLRSRTGARRELALGLLLAVASSSLALLVLLGAELAARRLAPDYLVRQRGLYVFSREYGWLGRPGAVAPMGSGSVTLNSRGFRGREAFRPKAVGGKRVLIIGDSVAFGHGVADEQTFAHLLDVRDNGIEVVNLAVGGYGPAQELLVLQRAGLGHRPDLVLLVVCLRNDFVDAALPVALYDGSSPRPVFRLEPGGALVLDDSAVRRPVAERVVRWLVDYSQLWNRLRRLLPRRERPEDPGWRQRKRQALGDPDYALRLSLALIREMRRVSRERGSDFLVATFPSGLAYELRVPLHEQLHAALRAEGFRLVDMGARLRGRGATPAAISLDKTGHLGPAGHALASEILEQEIASRP